MMKSYNSYKETKEFYFDNDIAFPIVFSLIATLNNKELHIEKSSTSVFISKEKERIRKEIESVL